MTDTKLTQGAGQVLLTLEPPDLRVTQGAGQILLTGPTPDLRVTQGAVQVLHGYTPVPVIEVAGSVRDTQVAALVLSQSDTDARVTQSVALVMYEVTTGVAARVTQSLALVMGEFQADIRITQSPVLVLADHVYTLTKWAQIWTITRTDGAIYRFTSLDRDLTFQGLTYQACDSMSPTASEMATQLGAIGNMELTGLISDTSITDEDLANGLFNGATVEVWKVPWENQGGEIPFRLLAGTLGDVRLGAVAFTAEVITPGATIQQRPLLDEYTPGCPYELGDARCAFDLPSLQVSGTVDAVFNIIAPNSQRRRKFTDSSRAEAAQYFDFGEITWTSGANSGITSDVKSFAAGVFVLWELLPNDIALGDTYTALPGCDKSTTTCTDTFDNFVNFGGFPDVPGSDRMIYAPDAKS